MKRSVNGMLAIATLLVSVSSAPLFGAGAKEKSLYDRLGGKTAITAVVDEFVGRVAGDKRINAYFAATASDPARLQRFKGKDMKTAHMGMGISGADFDAVVEDLVGALDKFKVGPHEKDQLLGALGPMKADIAGKR